MIAQFIILIIALAFTLITVHENTSKKQKH